MGAGEVARALGLTPAAIRLQLAHLEEDGLLARDTAAGATSRRGRPAHTYTLTAAAEALYPKRYGDLTTELLGYLGGPDGAQVDDLFEQRRRRRVEGALPRLAHLSFDEQVAALAAILDEDGYLADATRQEDGSWLVTEHNCAILTVAHGFSQACSSELSFIRDALPGAHGRAGGASHGRRPRVRLPHRPVYDVAGGDEVAGSGETSSTSAPSTSWISVRRSSTRCAPASSTTNSSTALSSTRSRMWMATMSPPTAPMRLATSPKAPGRSGREMRTT